MGLGPGARVTTLGRVSADPVSGFRFDLVELSRPTGTAGLRSWAEARTEPPPGTTLVLARTCPRWLPRLLPVFHGGEPLRVELIASAAPGFGVLLRSSLAALLAAAGRESGLEVLSWAGGLAVGGPGMTALPSRAHATLVVADLVPESAGPAFRMAAAEPPGHGWLVLHGDLPRLDSFLGIEAGALPGRVVRLPLLSPAELAAQRRGAAALAAGRRFGRALHGLATSLAGAYRGLVS